MINELPSPQELNGVQPYAEPATFQSVAPKTEISAPDALLLLASIVESSDDAIISKDLTGTITSWNIGAERMFGYTAEEIVGRNITTLIPPDLQHEEPTILERIREGKRIDHYETIRRHKSGALLEISVTISPIKDCTGKIIGASKIARDITERKRAERQSEALYELVARVNHSAALPEIYRAAVEAICRCQKADRSSVLLYDEDGVMRFKSWRGLSEGYRRAVEGHSPWQPDVQDPEPLWIDDIREAELGKHLRDVIDAEGIRALAFIPLTSEGRLIGKFMVYYDTPHRFTAAEVQPARTIASQVVFAIERQKRREALETLVNERTASLRRAIEQMEEFSYSVSHDLRAPARALQGYASVLLEDYGDRLDEQGIDYLKRIIRGSSRMDRLILDILTYSRLNRREVELRPISLDRLVREILQQYPETRHAHSEVKIPEPLLQVIGHEPSLSQAVSNLLSNAVKFVNPGIPPRVRIRTERRNGDVRLWVDDNGIGIRPEHQHRLFGMFERIHPETKFEGTGIGLAIVRKAVERMGGSVGVESDGLNGSSFWIQLPAAAPV